MILDTSTRRNLELCETLREKQKKGSLLWVLDKTKTAMGARTLRNYIEQPLISKEDFEKIQNALSLFELPTQMDGFNAEKVLSATKSDKKMVGNQIKFILLKTPGDAYIEKNLTDEQILEGIFYIYGKEN